MRFEKVARRSYRVCLRVFENVGRVYLEGCGLKRVVNV